MTTPDDWNALYDLPNARAQKFSVRARERISEKSIIKVLYSDEIWLGFVNEEDRDGTFENTSFYTPNPETSRNHQMVRAEVASKRVEYHKITYAECDRICRGVPNTSTCILQRRA